MNASSAALPALTDRPSLAERLHRQNDELFSPTIHPAVRGRVRDGRWEEALLAPVNDILNRPSKAIRARLVDAGFAMVRPAERAPDAAIALVEILHAGSLIVDDIEDDAKVRRGSKAIHRAHGMAKALNAGNWMYFLAMRQIDHLALPAEASLALHRRVNQTLLDCHRGQALDLSMRVGDMTQAEVPTLVAETSLLKTGALTGLGCALGTLVAGGNDEQVAAMHLFGMNLGLALQQLDDLGNLCGKSAAAKRYEDLRNGRLTWPWAWAAELLEPLAYRNLETAARSLGVTGLGGRPSARALANELVRVAGPHRRHFIVHRLRGSLNELATHFPSGDGIGQLREQIRTLEESYV